MMKKTHSSVTFFALRCDYRRTAVQIYFDCGAIFEVKMTEKKWGGLLKEIGIN